MKRRTFAVTDAGEFGRRTFEWLLEGYVEWVRLEAGDVAVNGAFTHPQWLW